MATHGIMDTLCGVFLGSTGELVAIFKDELKAKEYIRMQLLTNPSRTYYIDPVDLTYIKQRWGIR